MPSFRKTRDILAFALDAHYIDEEEFLLLCSANISKNPDFSVNVYSSFKLDEKNAAEVKAEFRFEKSDIPDFYQVLRIPNKSKCQQGSVCDGMTGLCILLKRLSYPCRFSDMIPTFVFLCRSYVCFLTLLWNFCSMNMAIS